MPPAAAAAADDETRVAVTQTALSRRGRGSAFGVACLTRADDASAWFAAYVLESLSIDNLFVFSLIFDYFQTPTAQPLVLRYGLLAAAAPRLSFICAGLAVVERFKGVLLVLRGSCCTRRTGCSRVGRRRADLSQNAIVKLTKQYLP